MATQLRRCACGCDKMIKREVAAGHDQKLRAAIENVCGGILELRKLVEGKFGVEAVERELEKRR